jgi:hypothetical protein
LEIEKAGKRGAAPDPDKERKIPCKGLKVKKKHNIAKCGFFFYNIARRKHEYTFYFVFCLCD